MSDLEAFIEWVQKEEFIDPQSRDVLLIWHKRFLSRGVTPETNRVDQGTREIKPKYEVYLANGQAVVKCLVCDGGCGTPNDEPFPVSCSCTDSSNG